MLYAVVNYAAAQSRNLIVYNKQQSEMETNQPEKTYISRKNKWDEAWLLIIPGIFLTDIFYSGDYSRFWFWTILVLMSAFALLILTRLFNRVYREPEKEIQQKDFELRYQNPGVFEYEKDGFNFTGSNQPFFVRWADIEAIFVYKRDLFTYDELNMEIFLTDEYRIRITEETDGWYQFIVKLKEVFPAIDKEFEVKLMFPAFETNLSLIYTSTGKSQTELINRYYEQYGS